MTAWWALLAVAAGAAIGVLATLAWARGRAAPQAGAERPTLPPAAATPPVAPAPAVHPFDGVERVLDVLPGAALLVDPSGAVVHATSDALALDLVRHGRLRVDELVALVRRSGRSGGVVEGDVSVRRGPRTRTVAELHVRVAPLSPDHLLVTAEDLSESRRVEAVRRDFVANVSHELKTPVGALALLAEAVMASKDDPAAVAHFAGRMQGEATRLGALVTDVIDLSRLQGGEPVPPPEAVSVDAVVAEGVDSTRQIAQAKGIRVERGGARGLVVHGQETQLATAVRNLLSNAINYSPEHTRVAVAVRPSADMIEISVTDQGIGIAESEQARIFERFYRVDPARSRGTGGTGLGLAIVKHVCANHGGDVVVWSRLGEGSTFTLRLPAAALPATIPAPSPPAVPTHTEEKVP